MCVYMYSKPAAPDTSRWMGDMLPSEDATSEGRVTSEGGFA